MLGSEPLRMEVKVRRWDGVRRDDTLEETLGEPLGEALDDVLEDILL